jgi:hypothetical protein
MFDEKTKYRFYKKLYKWSRRKFRDAHLDRYKNDIKCPFCKEWFSISGIDYKHEYIKPEPEWGTHVRCGQCGRDSYWNLVAFPFPVRAESNGDPIKDK